MQSICILFFFIISVYYLDSVKGLSLTEAAAFSSETVSMARVVKEQRGQRKPREISIETYTNRLSESESLGVLPKNSSREHTPLEEQTLCDGLGEINFFSGNPFVECTKGILHFYKSK